MNFKYVIINKKDWKSEDKVRGQLRIKKKH